MGVKATITALILDATAAGRAMVTAASAVAQKTLLSLQNVDNTSDASKPVSTAQQTAIDLRVPYTGANGAVNLGSNGITAGGVYVGTSNPSGLAHFAAGTTALGLVNLQQASADTDSFDVVLQKSRGSVTSPSVVTTGDYLGIIKGAGYGGASGFISAAEIRFVAEGTIANSRVPGRLEFWTGTNAASSVITRRGYFDSAGDLTLTGGKITSTAVATVSGNLASISTGAFNAGSALNVASAASSNTIQAAHTGGAGTTLVLTRSGTTGVSNNVHAVNITGTYNHTGAATDAGYGIRCTVTNNTAATPQRVFGYYADVSSTSSAVAYAFYAQRGEAYFKNKVTIDVDDANEQGLYVTCIGAGNKNEFHTSGPSTDKIIYVQHQTTAEAGVASNHDTHGIHVDIATAREATGVGPEHCGIQSDINFTGPQPYNTPAFSFKGSATTNNAAVKTYGGWLKADNTGGGACIPLYATSDTTAAVCVLEQYSNDGDGIDLGFRKSRGSLDTPTLITSGDELGGIDFYGCTDSVSRAFVKAARIACVSTGTVGTTRLSSYLTLSIGTDAAPTVMTEVLRLGINTLTLLDAVNVAMNTTTGTKIGTATGQKLAFWNQTPVVQQVLATGAGATVDNVISLLQTLGLCKQS